MSLACSTQSFHIGSSSLSAGNKPMGWVDSSKGAAPLTTWQENYASILAIENAKAPDLRSGIVLKSGEIMPAKTDSVISFLEKVKS